MKRALMLVMTLMMAISFLSAAQAAEVTLAVRMDRQMQNDGNGIRGSFVIHSDATAAESPLLAALANAEFSILRNAQDDQWHLQIFQSPQEDQQVNRTELLGKDGSVFLRSDFLPDTVMELPGAATLISGKLPVQGDNPSISGMMVSLFERARSNPDSWKQAFGRFERQAEIWLSEFASDPVITRDESNAVQMKLTYIIPEDKVRAYIVQLIQSFASDPEVLTLIAPAMSDEERNLYLNGNLSAYYLEALQQMRFEGGVRFEKVASARGEPLSTTLTLPLDPAFTRCTSCTFSESQGLISVILRSEEMTCFLTLPGSMEETFSQEQFSSTLWAGRIYSEKEKQEQNRAVRFDISKESESSYDEEAQRSHEIQRYTAEITRDVTALPEGIPESAIPEYADRHIDAVVHYSGKAGSNAPTTLELTVDYQRPDLKWTAEGKIRTSSTWPFLPFDPVNPVNVAEMDEGALGMKIAEFLMNAATKAIRSTESN